MCKHGLKCRYERTKPREIFATGLFDKALPLGMETGVFSLIEEAFSTFGLVRGKLMICTPYCKVHFNFLFGGAFVVKLLRTELLFYFTSDRNIR